METPPFKAGSTSGQAKRWASARLVAGRKGRVKTRGLARRDVLPGINPGASTPGAVAG